MLYQALLMNHFLLFLSHDNWCMYVHCSTNFRNALVDYNQNWKTSFTSLCMMFLMLLWVCIHTGQAEKFASSRVGIASATFGIPVQCSTNWTLDWYPKARGFDSHRGQVNFSACPVWMHTQSNRCTLRVTSQTSYSPEYIIPTPTKMSYLRKQVYISSVPCRFWTMFSIS
jgi:hypothetical protein